MREDITILDARVICRFFRHGIHHVNTFRQTICHLDICHFLAYDSNAWNCLAIAELLQDSLIIGNAKDFCYLTFGS